MSQMKTVIYENRGCDPLLSEGDDFTNAIGTVRTGIRKFRREQRRRVMMSAARTTDEYRHLLSPETRARLEASELDNKSEGVPGADAGA